MEGRSTKQLCFSREGREQLVHEFSQLGGDDRLQYQVLADDWNVHQSVALDIAGGPLALPPVPARVLAAPPLALTDIPSTSRLALTVADGNSTVFAPICVAGGKHKHKLFASRVANTNISCFNGEPEAGVGPGGRELGARDCIIY